MTKSNLRSALPDLISDDSRSLSKDRMSVRANVSKRSVGSIAKRSLPTLMAIVISGTICGTDCAYAAPSLSQTAAKALKLGKQGKKKNISQDKLLDQLQGRVDDAYNDLFALAAKMGLSVYVDGNGVLVISGTPQGAQGVAGPQGPQGPVGPTGPQGIPGEAAAIGATGPTGPVGPAGETGAAGPTGARGPTGERGPVGAVGAVGPKGDPGIQGPEGQPGPLGPQGPTGPAGPAGVVGASSVTSSHIMNRTIQAEDIATAAITAEELARDSVAASELADNSVNTTNIIDNSITTSDIASGAVGTAELASKSVTKDKLSLSGLPTYFVKDSTAGTGFAELTIGSWSTYNQCFLVTMQVDDGYCNIYLGAGNWMLEAYKGSGASRDTSCRAVCF